MIVATIGFILVVSGICLFHWAIDVVWRPAWQAVLGTFGGVFMMLVGGTLILNALFDEDDRIYEECVTDGGVPHGYLDSTG